jgi:hypothetical protein
MTSSSVDRSADSKLPEAERRNYKHVRPEPRARAAGAVRRCCARRGAVPQRPRGGGPMASASAPGHTRLPLTRIDGAGQVVDCIMRTGREEGVPALWKVRAPRALPNQPNVQLSRCQHCRRFAMSWHLR